MNVSYRWLLSLAPTIEGTPRQIADRLGMLGAPVDELTELGMGLGDILIARVEEVWPHPAADRLRLCRVNAGGELLQGVRFFGGGSRTHTLFMSCSRRLIRFVDSIHREDDTTPVFF